MDIVTRCMISQPPQFIGGVFGGCSGGDSMGGFGGIRGNSMGIRGGGDSGEFDGDSMEIRGESDGNSKYDE